MQTTTQIPEQDLQALAKKRVDAQMGFLTHLTVFVLVNAGLYLLNLLKGGASWQIFPLWGWGLGLTIHGIVTLLSLQGQGLRERLMNAELRTLRERALR